MHFRSYPEILACLHGLQLVSPSLVTLDRWNMGNGSLASVAATKLLYGAVRRKAIPAYRAIAKL